MKARLGRAAILTLLALGWTGVASAEPLSRSDAVRRALVANPNVLKARETLRGLEGRGQEALADALPELTLLGSVTRYRDPALLNSSSFDAFPPELRDSLRPVPANLYEGVLQLRQTVFSFKLRKAIRAAGYARDLGREEVRRAEQDVALATVRAYDAHLLAREKARVAERALRQREEHLAMARTRRAAGVATDLDVLRSEVAVANQRAVLLRLEGETEWALGALNAAMVRPIDTPLEPTDSLQYARFEPALEEVVSEALGSRPEVKGIGLSERAYDELVGIARSEARPRLDLVGSWGYSVRRPGDFLDSDFTKWSAALTLTVPVFDGRRSAGRVAQAQAERARLAQDRVALETGIRLEARQAVDRLRVFKGVLDATELGVSAAAKALALTQANYNYGAATTLDVLDAQAALTLAESLRVEALHDHASARALVRYVMGREVLDPAPGPPEPVSSLNPPRTP